MDLIGHDTNFAVTQSVYEANFFDKRYVPSLVQREMVDGGLLGRKSGRGFYRYQGEAPARRRCRWPCTTRPPPRARSTVHGDGPVADWLEQAATAALAAQGWGPARERGSGWTGLADRRRAPGADRRPHAPAKWPSTLGSADVAVFDRPLALPVPAGSALAYAVAARRQPAWRDAGGGLARRARLRAAARWPTRPAWWSRARWRC